MSELYIISNILLEEAMKKWLKFDKVVQIFCDSRGGVKLPLMRNGKERSYVFFWKRKNPNVSNWTVKEFITAQYSIHHCKFLNNHCTNWSSLHLKLTLASTCHLVMWYCFTFCFLDCSNSCSEQRQYVLRPYEGSQLTLISALVIFCYHLFMLHSYVIVPLSWLCKD